MRASIIIASHNEGDLLAKTVSSCIETCSDLDCEIIVADDASTDGSVEAVVAAFPQIRLCRNDHRQGVSPTKALGAKNADGNVLVFLDGHTKPENDSLTRLVQDVEDLSGAAIVTPAIPALDVRQWRSDGKQIGNGYSLDLLTFESSWCSLDAMRPVDNGRKRFYESPAVIGCTLAVARQLYDKLLGFDEHMLYWGVEDLDFGLKCWLMGNSILHDPEVSVGHRFQMDFENYSVPPEHVLVNHLRMAYKNFTHEVWAKWMDRCRQRNTGGLAGHPEGLWARVWHLFNTERASADQQRAHVHAGRVRDEFSYAERFGLNWPRMELTQRPVSPYMTRFALASPQPERVRPRKPRRSSPTKPRRTSPTKPRRARKRAA
jgi:GT2 family glycosyltransferase